MRTVAIFYATGMVLTGVKVLPLQGGYLYNSTTNFRQYAYMCVGWPITWLALLFSNLCINEDRKAKIVSSTAILITIVCAFMLVIPVLFERRIESHLKIHKLMQNYCSCVNTGVPSFECAESNKLCFLTHVSDEIPLPHLADHVVLFTLCKLTPNFLKDTDGDGSPEEVLYGDTKKLFREIAMATTFTFNHYHKSPLTYRSRAVLEKKYCMTNLT